MEQLERLKQIMFVSDARILELFLALYSLIWGLWLMLPFETFATNFAFAVMNKIAPEYVWGTIAATAASIKIHGLAVNHGYGQVQKSASLALVFVWLCAAISCAVSAPLAVDTPLFSTIAITNIFCIWRRGR